MPEDGYENKYAAGCNGEIPWHCCGVLIFPNELQKGESLLAT
jgi:hypothetical protein